jgi:ribosomal protein S18 acetylase RimI-like enzyme
MQSNEELKFEFITEKNFENFKQYILRSELIFPEYIRSDEEDYIEMLKQANTIAFAVFLGSEYIGNIIGCELTGEDMEICKPYISPGKRALYIYNFVVENGYRHKGYGCSIFTKLIETAKNMGFQTIVAHCRENESFHIFKKFGGVQKASFEKWEGGEETYVLCELDITSIETHAHPNAINKIHANNLSSETKLMPDMHTNLIETSHQHLERHEF